MAALDSAFAPIYDHLVGLAVYAGAEVRLRFGGAAEREAALAEVMSALMEEVLFELPDYHKQIVFDGGGVRERLAKIVNDDDLRRYIL